MELKAEPYTLKLRPDVQRSELSLRSNLNLQWCGGVLFNVLAFKNMANKVEFDAVLWNNEAILFIEYKDSPSVYKNLEAKRAQQIKGISRNIARAFGFTKYRGSGHADRFGKNQGMYRKIKGCIEGGGDTTLIEYCISLTLQRFGCDCGANVATKSEIPIASGLKSSSAAANAAVLATLDALGEKLDVLEAVKIGVQAALEAKVTITGAFDDACASMHEEIKNMMTRRD